MSLSNTATPFYYGRFRSKVLRGEIPVSYEVAMQMALIDELIADPRYYYDDEAVEGWIRYCEDELVLTDGSKFSMLDSFKLWAEDVLSWFYFEEHKVPVVGRRGGIHYEKRLVKKRLRNKQYLIVGRGAAKSMYDAFMQSYGLNMDTTTTDQIVTAPTMKLSEAIMGPLRTAITRSTGPLHAFLTEGSKFSTKGSQAKRVKLDATKEGVINYLTNSIVRVLPMSIDKLQGLRCKYATVDEWLSVDVREDVVGAIEQGASKISDYLIVASSSEGTIRNGSGDTVKMELSQILHGDYKNPHVSIWWYKLDDISEVNKPAMWAKANPNIGITVSYETYQLDVERAEHNPSVRNDILAKRFGLPVEGCTYFFPYEETLPHPKKTYWQMGCSMGADMSQGDDFCSFTFLFPLGGDRFGVKSLSFITTFTYNNLPQAIAVKYDEFRNEGSLIVLDGTILDMDVVYNEVERHIEENEYDVRCFGYDPFNAKAYVSRWCTEHGEYGVEKVIQGARTESVPLGELKKLSEQRKLLFDESIMSFAMGNCMTIEDTNGNRKLMKRRRENKIDPVAAMMDAFIAYKNNLESFE